MRLRSSARPFDGRLDLPPANLDEGKNPLGELMLSSGVLSRADLDEIAARQRRSGEDFGTAAVAMGKVSPVVLQQFLSGTSEFSLLDAGDRRVDPRVVAAFDPYDPYVVDIRSIRGSMLSRWQSSGREVQRSVVVVGLDSSVDISLMVANLAVVWAQLGWSTLLVDSDLELPSQHELFRSANDLGLSDMLQGATGANSLPLPTAIEKLSLIPAGPPAPNSFELLEKSPLLSTLEPLGSGHRLILAGLSRMDDRHSGAIDHIFSGFDGAIIVVRRDNSSLRDLQRLIAELNEGGLEVLGTILDG